MKHPVNYHSLWVFECTVLFALSVSAQSSQLTHSNVGAVSPNPRSEDAGTLQLKRGYPDLAKTTCENALKADPKNEAARKCLDEALVELEARDAAAQERTLAQAESLLRLGKKTDALAAVEKIQANIRRPQLADRAISIVQQAGKPSLMDRIKQPLSEGGVAWILDVLIGGALIALTYWTLKLLRYFRRTRKAFKFRYLGLRTHWRVTAVEDKTALGASSFVLSAYDSMKSDLSDSSNPILLFVQPFDVGAGGRCVLVRDVDAGPGNAQPSGAAPVPRPEGFLELKQQNFEFLDAVKELGVKVGGTDFAGVGNFLAGIGKWFNAGVPTLTGLAFTDAGRVVVSLTCCDAKRFATVSAKGLDATVDGARDAAESAVYKMLYFLGHDGSSAGDADAAADLRKQSRELQKYLSGELPADELLSTLCNNLAETRRRVTLSPTAPGYLIDRARMWEAAARFLRNEKGDLDRALELLERLRGSKGRTGLQHDIYNVAVVSQLLGREKLRNAHDRLLELSRAPDPWRILVVFEKVRLLANTEFQKVWDAFADDVRAWKTELLASASRPVQSPSDELIHDLRRLQPADAVVWEAILSAELDCPKPARPADPSGVANRVPTLQAVQAFFKSTLSALSEDMNNAYLNLARVQLYLGNFEGARKWAAEYKKRSKDPGVIATYVEAEATYSDPSLNPLKRTVRANDLIQSFSDVTYAPLQALRDAIASDLASPTP